MTREEAMDVYKDRSAKFINTQSIQWKMNLSIWTLLSLGVFYKSKIEFPSCEQICSWDCFVVLLIGITAILIHGRFCYKIQKSLDSDKAVKDMIVAQLNSTIEPINVGVDLTASSNNSPWQWVVIQVSITGLLALAFIVSN